MYVQIDYYVPKKFCKMVMIMTSFFFAVLFSALTDCNVQGSKACRLPFGLGELICGF